MTVASQSRGSEFKAKRLSNGSEETNSINLHSYMKQMYRARAQGNGNGSFTISLGTQKIVATSIRGFEPQRSGKYCSNALTSRNLLRNLEMFLFNVQ